MARYVISDTQGFFTADIETRVASLVKGMQGGKGESIISTAMLMAMATLAEGGDWPLRALAHMRAFMEDMQASVEDDRDRKSTRLNSSHRT